MPDPIQPALRPGPAELRTDAFSAVRPEAAREAEDATSALQPQAAPQGASEPWSLQPLISLCELAARVVERRESLQREVAEGYLEATRSVPRRASPIALSPSIPGGMLEALCIAGALGRDTRALDHHYTRSMPAGLARQLFAARVAEEPLFTTRLSLQRMPRFSRGLEALFARVAAAGLSCAQALGASTPERLLEARGTLGALYAGCHFGRSMPMLYAAPGDVLAMGKGSPGSAGCEQDALAWIDARYAGPLLHELSHLNPLDPALVPAPGNLHEALAAWLGSEAFPEQLWPRLRDVRDPMDSGGLDALPGGAFFASVGGWIARALGEAGAIRVQAGALDLREALGDRCASALRLYGWLPHLESSAPHLLADTFAPDRWWKLVDLHRDPALAEAFEEALVRPLLATPPPPRGTPLVARWNHFLDDLDWSTLPAWRDPIGAEDEKLALRACRALCVRSVRQGGSFRAEQAEPPAWPEPAAAGPLRLEVRACALRANWPGPDAVGAPGLHPAPPSICAAYARLGVQEVQASASGIPLPPAPAGQASQP